MGSAIKLLMPSVRLPGAEEPRRNAACRGTQYIIGGVFEVKSESRLRLQVDVNVD